MLLTTAQFLDGMALASSDLHQQVAGAPVEAVQPFTDQEPIELRRDLVEAGLIHHLEVVEIVLQAAPAAGDRLVAGQPLVFLRLGLHAEPLAQWAEQPAFTGQIDEVGQVGPLAELVLSQLIG
ncbi:MAG: hypothetical protein IPO34_18670 [Dehalococcoidia bacterium]|nr:hypothetical protein [Dehalococcoidia bacterium]